MFTQTFNRCTKCHKLTSHGPLSPYINTCECGSQQEHLSQSEYASAVEQMQREYRLAQDGGPATEKQLAYLRTLKVAIAGHEHEISKNLASNLIDAAKNERTVGYLGYTFTDGSF